MRPIKLSKKEWGLGVLASLLAIASTLTIPDPLVFVPMVVGSLLCCLFLAYHHEGRWLQKTVFVFVAAAFLALVSYRNLWGLRARVIVAAMNVKSLRGNTTGCTIYLATIKPAGLPGFSFSGQENTDNNTSQMSNRFPSDVTKDNLVVVSVASRDISENEWEFIPIAHLNVKMQFPNDINSFRFGTLNESPRGLSMAEAEIGKTNGGECYVVQTTAVDDPSIVVTQSGPATLEVNGSTVSPGKTITLFIVPYINRRSFSPPTGLSIDGSFDYAYNGIARHKTIQANNLGSVAQ